MNLDLAIIELQRSRELHTYNAPIHDLAGDKAQAKLCLQIAQQCNEAQHILESYIAYSSVFENV